jgi:NlpC/P60 family putative phage cell wall peptidase
MDSAAMIAEAKSWTGTPWVHGVALKGVGTDCVQFIIALGRRSGWIPEGYRPPVYSRDWSLHNEHSLLLEELARFARPVEREKSAPGDVLAFRQGRCAGHAGLYLGEGRFIHAVVGQGIRESRLVDGSGHGGSWLERLDSVWRPR